MAPVDENALVAALGQGDEAAFRELVTRYHNGLKRVARTFVSSDASADEVVQDTWTAVLTGIASFEGRSSVKTWIFRILVNRAKTKGVRDARMVPESSLGNGETDGSLDNEHPAVDAARFDSRGMWSAPPQRWGATSPQAHVLRQELVLKLQAAIAQLPERQSTIIVMRDALGWSSEEVCNVLEISESNQRVLLHRGRARLRSMLEEYKTNG
ncbi:MAG: RNA polymerase sigma factor [Kofleriaceae bacterium]|nr:RNA polymerase sigma factor [Kofleriaceae bacterium]